MKLKDRRLSLDMTQEFVAKNVGIDQGSISAYESGSHKPKYFVAARLANLYGCTVEEIYAGISDESEPDAK